MLMTWVNHWNIATDEYENMRFAWTHSAYVVNEFAKLQRGIFSTKHRDLWAVVRRCVKSRPDRKIRCVKVKAHTTEEDLAVGRYGITKFTREGAKLADKEAGDAAYSAAVPHIETREVRLQDAFGFLLLRRMPIINMHCAKLDAYKHDKQDERVDRKRSIRSTVCLTEHLWATEHSCRRLSDRWKCMVCRSFTNRAG